MENAAAFASGPVGIRVLVVEEDPSDLAALTQILQRHGYQVTAMASPEEGLRALRENPAEGFDLVMTVVHTQGPGIDGFELLKHAKQRCPVILFSGYEPRETVMRAMIGGACDILVKPLRDEEMHNIWHHVLRRQVNAAAANADAPIGDVVVRQDDTARKRGSAALHDSDEGNSHGSRQQKQARTTNTTMFNSSAQLHASIVRAAEQLRGTEDYSPRGILDLLVAQGVEVTAEQVTSHLEKYRRDCLKAMPMASSSYSNNKWNYSTPGSLGFHLRSQGTTDINQTSLLRNGASPVGSGVYGNESYRASQAGLIQYSGNLHENSNGFHYGNGQVNGSMVSASLLSNVEQTVQRAMPEGYSNGHGGLVQNGSVVGASLQSNLAQPVHQELPNNTSFPSSMIHTMDDPNPIGQQEFPRISRLRYDGKTGGISMIPWPVPPVDDDGEELLRSYLEGDNEVMNNAATTQGMQGDGSADGHVSASQPQDFTDLLRWESNDGNGTGNTSGGDGTGLISASQPQDLTDLLSWENADGNGTAGTSGGSGGVVADGIVDCELVQDEMINFF